MFYVYCRSMLMKMSFRVLSKIKNTLQEFLPLDITESDICKNSIHEKDTGCYQYGGYCGNNCF
jgi:hypothetical protein